MKLIIYEKKNINILLYNNLVTKTTDYINYDYFHIICAKT